MAEEEAQKESKEKAPAKHVGALSAGGAHAVIVAQPAPLGMPLPQVSRRTVVIAGFWSGLGALALAGVAGLVNFMWPRAAQRAAGKFVLDVNANDIPVGGKRDYVILQPNKQNPLQNLETKLFLVHLNEEQAALNLMPDKAGAYLALSRKCPHLGCTVPYNEAFPFGDPANGGKSVIGWFRCPCHGSTYSDSGRRVFGPAPRSMDLFALSIAADGTMTVDLSTTYKGATKASPDNPGNIAYAVFLGADPA
jgi:Rieske Fe-S protein